MATTPADVPPRQRLETCEVHGFQKSLRKIGNQDGTVGGAAYQEAIYALECWKRGDDPKLTLTNHGESRIKHAVKYDLRGFYRLITLEDAGQRILLFVGTHADCEKWLDSHKGMIPVVNKKTKRIAFHADPEDSDTKREVKRPYHPTASGPILSMIDAELVGKLGLSAKTAKQLEKLAIFEDAHTEEMWEIIDALAYPSDEIATAVRECLTYICAQQINEATSILELALGIADRASDEPEEFIKALDSGLNSDVILRLKDLDIDRVMRAVTAPGVTDWMLFIHPDQRVLVEREFSGPAKLFGVSGSGKTSVMVHRAVALAQKYPGERVLVLCLNPSLGALIRVLVKQLGGEELEKRIDVRTVYDICHKLCKLVKPSRLLQRSDPRSGETLHDTWQDFLAKDQAKPLFKPVADGLEASDDKIDASAYVRDELDWIRSGFGPSERNDYLTCERTGRGLKFPLYEGTKAPERQVGPMPVNTRQLMLNLLREFESYMDGGDMRDDDGVSLLAYELRAEAAKLDEFNYRCVLLDECQDCSTLELAVIASIPRGVVDGLFVCGDAVQKVLPKQHDLARAKINVKGRSVILRKNYRNSRQILQAAFTLIDAFRAESGIPSADVLEPEYAVRTGNKPSLYECNSVQEEIDLVHDILELFDKDEQASICVCSPLVETLELFEDDCKRRGIEVQRIRGDVVPAAQGVKTSLIQDIKGYEFTRVFLLDLSDKPLPRRSLPTDEWWRDAFQVYVAMTRAREELVMTFVFNRTILLKALGDTVHEGKWASGQAKG